MKALASSEEVGALLHRRPDTIFRWAEKGLIPSVPAGEDYVFDLDEVARWSEVRQNTKRQARPRPRLKRPRR